ncbi:hypothetical protein HY251_15245 [bacterium]|nr:hypothetical protein [bacterium]
MRLIGYCKDCEAALTARAADASVTCSGCGRAYPLSPSPGIERGEPVERCVFCGYSHLHVRKDFPRRLGLAIVALAAVLTFTPITPPGLFFLPLVIASLIDLLLYGFIPWKVVCYVCDAEYRGGKVAPGLEPFDLATATEKHRLRWPRPTDASREDRSPSSVPGPRA